MDGSLEATRRAFSDLIGKIGDAWGLPEDACRVHALLYVKANGATRADIAAALDLTDEAVSAALAFLQDYELAWSRRDDVFEAHADPWEAMMKGLDQRRGRDLPGMRKSLEDCRGMLGAEVSREAAQISKMIRLVDDLSAIHAQAFRVSPRLLRGVVGVSGRAARLLGRTER